MADNDQQISVLGIALKKKSAQIPGNVLDFQRSVDNAGIFELDPGIIADEGLNDQLPAGSTKKDVWVALKLFGEGVVDLEKDVDKLTLKNKLSAEDAKYFYSLAYWIELFREANKTLAAEIQTSQQPTISMVVNPQTPADQGDLRGVFLFQRDESQGTFTPILQGAMEKGMSFAKQHLHDLVVSSLKKAGKKFAMEAAKQFGKKAVSTGARLAAKAGVVAASGAAATGTMGLSLLVQAALKAAKELWKKIKSLLPREINNWREKHKKEIAGSAVVLAGLGAVLGNIFMVLGGVGLGIVGAGGFAGLTAWIFARYVVPFFVRIGVMILATILGIAFVVAICYLIINQSAYMVPHNESAIIPPRSGQSQFFRVNKLVDGKAFQEYGNRGRVVTYEITITATQGTLENISFRESCDVSKEGGVELDCPPMTNFTTNFGPSKDDPEDTSPLPPAPDVISPTTPYVLTYQRSFNTNYNDSLVIDTFRVTATTAGNTSSGAGSASICFGDCPNNCPSIWPVQGGTYVITQGPDGTTSHIGLEAIDIAPISGFATLSDRVVATHTGTVRSLGWDPLGGNWAIIDAYCNGSFSSHYGHLLRFRSDLHENETIHIGETIGIMDSTGGWSTGDHVHYEFKGNPLIRMEQPFVPRVNTITGNIPRGCTGYMGCGAIIIMP